MLLENVFMQIETDIEKIQMLEPILFIMMAIGVLAFIFIMFLPALLELKWPKDSGPRKIMPGIIGGKVYAEISWLEIDGERIDHAIIKRVSEIMAALPNLEL